MATTRVRAVRRNDQLALEFDLVNLTVASGSDGPVLQQDGSAGGLIILHFPPQNSAEEAFLEKAPEFDPPGDSEPLPDLARGRMAGPTRLVFDVPAGRLPIPFTLEGLLDACRTLPLRVADRALPPELPDEPGAASVPDAPELSAAPSPAWRRIKEFRRRARERAVGRPAGEVRVRSSPALSADPVLPHSGLTPPGDQETAIETPYRLILSPHGGAAWGHATGAVEHAGRFELWHTRLGVRSGETGVDERDDDLRTVRAIWTRDPLFPFSNPGNPPDHDATDPFRTSLDANDRHQIVHLSSNFSLPTATTSQLFQPQAVAVRHLMLSSMGAWLDSRIAWDKRPSGFDMEEWRHIAAQGRDHYVRVVYAGRLFPFGHRASLIKVTERKFHPNHPANSSSTAFLRQRYFIVVREPVRTYGVRTELNHYLTLISVRKMPLRSVRIKTLVTPTLDYPPGHAVRDYGQDAFWPYVSARPFRFQLAATDKEENTVEFTAPIIWVSDTVLNPSPYTDGPMKDVQADYRAASDLATSDLSGQKLAFAESARVDDTAFDTRSLSFDAELSDNPLTRGRLPPFFPTLRSAQIEVPAIRNLTGAAEPAEVEYDQDYLDKGFPEEFPGEENANTGHQIFLKVTGGQASVDFAARGDRSGGLVQPNFKLAGLSRRLGPVGGDLGSLKGDQFDPKKFFEGLDAKIFGVINLWDIIQAANLDDLERLPILATQSLDAVESFLAGLERLEQIVKPISDLDEFHTLITTLIANFPNIQQSLDTFALKVKLALDVLPSLSVSDGIRKDLEQRLRRFQTLLAGTDTDTDTGTALEELAQGHELPKGIESRFEWRPELKKWPDPNPIFEPANLRGLLLSVQSHAQERQSAQPSFEVSCTLENFDIHLIAPTTFLTIHFDRMQFLMRDGQKPDVNVDIGEIRFDGVLAFVETLKDMIPSDGFSDPPDLDVTAQGITASYTLSLPNAAVGIFSMENISLGAAFNLPFIAEPLSVRFNFAERENPFVITYSCLGGGGFFGICLTASGVMLLEAALEAGARISIDFGVASGAVSVMLGIYFAMAESDADLAGYLRIRGDVDVLGVVSVSIELRMELHYEFASEKVAGRATLILEIDVAVFSDTVEITCERRFAGPNGDPTFLEIMTDPDDPAYDPWGEYCLAFAA